MKLNKFFGLCVLASSIALAGCGGDKKQNKQQRLLTLTKSHKPSKLAL